MTRKLSDDDSFFWQNIAGEIMKEMTRANPRLGDEFAKAKNSRSRVELLLSDGVAIRSVASRVWDRYDRFADGKSGEASVEFRAAGNQHFRRKRLDSASAAYTLAVFKAETDSEPYALALANRSACLFETGELTECLEDVEMALATNRYPTRLKGKILKRKVQCLKRLGRDLPEAERTLVELRTMERGDGKNYDEQLRRLRVEWNRDGGGNEVDAIFAEERRSEKVFSPDISVRYSTEDLGRHVVADRNVDVGRTLIEEPAFAHILIPDHNLMYCQRCLKSKPNLIPCDACSEVGYCGRECRDAAIAEHHANECDYAHLLSRIGIAHLSYRIVNQVGIEGVLATHRRARENVDDRTFGVEDTIGDYDGVYALLTHEEETTSADAFMYALTVVLMLKMLCDQNENLKTAFAFISGATSDVDIRAGPFVDLVILAEVLLRHVLQLICNASAITAVVSEPTSSNLSSSSVTTTEDQVRIATAIFPRLSLLNHSCDPNVIVSYVGTTVTAKATRPIEAGCQVFNCYGPHFARMVGKERRDALKRQYHFHCVCDKCGAEEEKESGGVASGFQDNSRALKCPECEGPMQILRQGASFQCMNCAYSPGEKRTQELRQRVGKLLQAKKALKKGAESDFAAGLTYTLLADAEEILHKDNVHLAEIYDVFAFIHSNNEDMETAFKVIMRKRKLRVFSPFCDV